MPFSGQRYERKGTLKRTQLHKVVSNVAKGLAAAVDGLVGAYVCQPGCYTGHWSMCCIVATIMCGPLLRGPPPGGAVKPGARVFRLTSRVRCSNEAVCTASTLIIGVCGLVPAGIQIGRRSRNVCDPAQQVGSSVLLE